MEQLHTKEVELLQLRTEMDTSQGTGRVHRPAVSELFSGNGSVL